MVLHTPYKKRRIESSTHLWNADLWSIGVSRGDQECLAIPGIGGIGWGGVGSGGMGPGPGGFGCGGVGPGGIGSGGSGSGGRGSTRCLIVRPPGITPMLSSKPSRRGAAIRRPRGACVARAVLQDVIGSADARQPSLCSRRDCRGTAVKGPIRLLNGIADGPRHFTEWSHRRHRLPEVGRDGIEGPYRPCNLRQQDRQFLVNPMERAFRLFGDPAVSRTRRPCWRRSWSRPRSRRSPG